KIAGRRRRLNTENAANFGSKRLPKIVFRAESIHANIRAPAMPARFSFTGGSYAGSPRSAFAQEFLGVSVSDAGRCCRDGGRLGLRRSVAALDRSRLGPRLGH